VLVDRLSHSQAPDEATAEVRRCGCPWATIAGMSAAARRKSPARTARICATAVVRAVARGIGTDRHNQRSQADAEAALGTDVAGRTTKVVSPWTFVANVEQTNKQNGFSCNVNGMLRRADPI
jgi:hypothetical protein